mmetsp:Transcript_22387/g.37443  ORF Transcript_22387/g.37443 Transcript_22387/m.37443 type:complete len:362 (-) Transcript_22387:112-1197(-)
MKGKSKLFLVCGTIAVVYLINLALIHRKETKDCNEGTTVAKSDPVIEDDEPTKLLVVSRVHMKSASHMPDPAKVVQFVKNSLPYGQGILICVGATEYSLVDAYIESMNDLLSKDGVPMGNVTFLPVTPWGIYTTALNAAVLYAQDHLYNRIAFQSIEFYISSSDVYRMLKRLNRKNTIVVGPAMDGHDFQPNINAAGADRSGTGSADIPLSSLPVAQVPPGTSSVEIQTLRGRTCPWNTFAIWRVKELGFTGFALIGDGLGSDRTIAGVEELSTITLLQRINPKYQAVLVKLVTSTAEGKDSSNRTGAERKEESISWDTKFSDDPERQEYHRKKMLSKDLRPLRQMEALGISPGLVRHELI